MLPQSPKPSAGRRVGEANWKLIDADPFLCFLLLDMPYRVLKKGDALYDAIPTAATDFSTIYYNEDWIGQLLDPMLAFVVAHEAGHIILRHMARGHGRHKDIWNAAGDYVINAMLQNSIAKIDNGRIAKFPVIDGEPIGLLKPEWSKLTTEEVYQLLKENSSSTSAPGGAAPNGKRRRKSKNLAAGPTSAITSAPKNWDLILGIAESLPESARTQLEADRQARVGDLISKALARADNHRQNRGKGTEPSDFERVARGAFKPKVDWRQHLRSLLQGKGKGLTTWQTPNRKLLPHGFYAPSTCGVSFGRMGAVYDTSGSIGDEELGQTTSELNNLLMMGSNIELFLWTCDAAVHGPDRYTSYHRIPPDKKLKGGGGTDFRPAFEAAAKVPGLHTLVYFTDTFGTFPETPPRFDVIWVVPEGAGNSVPFGALVRVPIPIG